MSTPVPVVRGKVSTPSIAQQPKAGLVYTNQSSLAPINLQYRGVLRNLDKHAHVLVQFHDLPCQGKPFRAFASVPAGTKNPLNLSVPSRTVVGLETSPVTDITSVSDAAIGFLTDSTNYLLCNIRSLS